ncbi:MAG: hypothetical protein ACRCX2_15060 [Paraclostridium sp.]
MGFVLSIGPYCTDKDNLDFGGIETFEFEGEFSEYDRNSSNSCFLNNGGLRTVINLIPSFFMLLPDEKDDEELSTMYLRRLERTREQYLEDYPDAKPSFERGCSDEDLALAVLTWMIDMTSWALTNFHKSYISFG